MHNLLKMIDLKNEIIEIIQNSNLISMRKNDRKQELELDILQLNQLLFINMLKICSIISLVLPILIKRVSNCRYYKKSILAPEILDSVLQL